VVRPTPASADRVGILGGESHAAVSIRTWVVSLDACYSRRSGGHWTKVQYANAVWRRRLRGVVARSELVVRVLVLSVTSAGFKATTGTGDGVDADRRSGDPAGPISRPWRRRAGSRACGRRGRRSTPVRNGVPRFHRAADDLFDVNEMARRARLHWKYLVPSEQHEFIRLCRDPLTQAFVTIVQPNTGDNVPSLPEDVAGTFAWVHSRIRHTNGSEVGESAQGRLAAGVLHGAAYAPGR
jgi:hypothetical protein